MIRALGEFMADCLDLDLDLDLDLEGWFMFHSFLLSVFRPPDTVEQFLQPF
jgi:hypothetical protein